MKIYSKVKPELLLHIVNRFTDIDARQDIIPESNFLQCSAFKLQQGKTFKPHFHIKKEKRFKEFIAQESWVVLKGKVKCIFYDIDNSIINTIVLEAGDASYTLYGGHNYEILENDTIVYEFKTGPYEGSLNDKEFIKHD